ncbi:hypothetical protein J1N35_023181 [Gossypium stocksii]|uniref:Zinc knuckle CX2CX4HX4C domain-containing protein n=1 Tax=Gossypium stocksii TaxID=47602 RepID=A0A9D3VHF2_9ROSI|nr:hypothetical protein J1N35_023181 [Gossypium stocksii]
MSILEFRVHDLLLGFHLEALTRNTGKCHGLFSRIQCHLQSYWVEQLHVYQGQIECSKIAYERVPLVCFLCGLIGPREQTCRKLIDLGEGRGGVGMA